MEEKPNTEGGEQKKEVITVKLTGPDNSVVEIRARPTTKVDKLLTAYAQQKNISAKNFKLMDPEGKQLRADITLADAEVEDGDQLSVVMEQVGGR